MQEMHRCSDLVRYDNFGYYIYSTQYALFPWNDLMYRIHYYYYAFFKRSAFAIFIQSPYFVANTVTATTSAQRT